MRQLLLRVPDDVHRRLAARAQREGRSVNSVANEILDAAVDADQSDPRTRLRSRAQAAGVLREVPAQRVDPARRRSAVEAMRGIGPVLDDLLDEERDRP
ncbi:MAG TPA: toxin-antitoxin system HicB family antitoxin [Pseudonocardia sp.]|nr:toxin-antitoxin system HicB family antitoxin [Pseudonocardia sp.]